MAHDEQGFLVVNSGDADAGSHAQHAAAVYQFAKRVLKVVSARSLSPGRASSNAGVSCRAPASCCHPSASRCDHTCAQAARTPMPHNGQPTQVRIGIHSGPVVSGVVGNRMPKFCKCAEGASWVLRADVHLDDVFFTPDRGAHLRTSPRAPQACLATA